MLGRGMRWAKRLYPASAIVMLVLVGCRSSVPPSQTTVQVTVPLPSVTVDMSSEESSISAGYEIELSAAHGVLGNIVFQVDDSVATDELNRWLEQMLDREQALAMVDDGVIVIGKAVTPASTHQLEAQRIHLEAGTVTRRHQQLCIWIRSGLAEDHQPIGRIVSGRELLESLEQLRKPDGTLSGEARAIVRRR